MFFFLLPQVALAPSTNLDPDQSLNTHLILKNIGHVPIWNIRFTIELKGTRLYIGELGIGPLQPIATLGAGESVARQFASRSIDTQVQVVAITVHYNWPIPFLLYEPSKTYWFTVEHGTAGYLMAPTYPRPDIPTIIRYRG